MYVKGKINVIHLKNTFLVWSWKQNIAIYTPKIYTAPCVMFLMRADTYERQVGEGWALEIESFLGSVKWHRADRRVSFGAQKTRDFQGPTPSHLPT